MPLLLVWIWRTGPAAINRNDIKRDPTLLEGASRKINTELFELSGLPEKPGQNSTGNFLRFR
jgi:hypothetical protein